MGRPWVLDPVGIGASAERRSLATRLSGLQPTIIRGNAAEILAMAESEATPVAGVDSAVDSAEALDAAHDLSRSTGALVAVSGSVDYVTDGSRLAAVANGHHLMTRVTGVIDASGTVSIVVAPNAGGEGVPMSIWSNYQRVFILKTQPAWDVDSLPHFEQL